MTQFQIEENDLRLSRHRKKFYGWETGLSAMTRTGMWTT